MTAQLVFDSPSANISRPSVAMSVDTGDSSEHSSEEEETLTQSSEDDNRLQEVKIEHLKVIRTVGTGWLETEEDP